MLLNLDESDEGLNDSENNYQLNTEVSPQSASASVALLGKQSECCKPNSKLSDTVSKNHWEKNEVNGTAISEISGDDET